MTQGECLALHATHPYRRSTTAPESSLKALQLRRPDVRFCHVQRTQLHDMFADRVHSGLHATVAAPPLLNAQRPEDPAALL